jgi:hypothetical protein
MLSGAVEARSMSLYLRSGPSRSGAMLGKQGSFIHAAPANQVPLMVAESP